MSVENQLGILSQINIGLIIKSFLILFLVFYVFFALIMQRQIQVMNKKLPTLLSPSLKFIAILHIGISLAVLFFVLGSF